jgi:hypothetical protein
VIQERGSPLLDLGFEDRPYWSLRTIRIDTVDS